MFVGSSAEADSVVESLLEKGESGDECALFGFARDRVRGEASGESLFSGNARGDDACDG